MENTLKIIQKGQTVLVQIKPNFEKEYSVIGSIHNKRDTLKVKYDEKYVGEMITIRHHEAGFNEGYSIHLEKGGSMEWKTGTSKKSNYSIIIFSGRKEIVFEFSVES